MELTWSTDGLPVFDASAGPGFTDFFAVYEQEEAAILADLLPLVARTPSLQAVLSAMTSAQMEEQSAKSKAMMRQAIIGSDWKALLDQQRSQGAFYANLNVPLRDWFDLVGGFQQTLIPKMLARFAPDIPRLSAALTAMNRYVDVSMSVVGEAYLGAKQKRIEQQALAIAELSTPVLQLRDRLLLLPIIGVLDTHRARQLTEELLRNIRAQRARVVVMDITGVAAVDSRVANHLLQTVEAARLMGARVLVTGVTAEVATTMVTLGVDLSSLATFSDLQSGIEEAERRLNGLVEAGPMPSDATA